MLNCIYIIENLTVVKLNDIPSDTCLSSCNKVVVIDAGFLEHLKLDNLVPME